MNLFFKYKNLLVIVFSILLMPVISYPDVSKKVFIVHSYHETQTGHVVEMTEGILEGMGKECRPLIKFYHMDTKRKNSLEWKILAGKTAETLMDSFNPDVVIAMDDNAQEFFAKKCAKQNNAPFFVFGGVNAEPEKYDFPTENVTGVLERPNVLESIDLLKKISPNVQTIVLLSDKSPTTDFFHQYVKKLDLPIKVVASKSPETLEQWKRVITQYKNQTDAFGVYVIRTIKRSETDETPVPESELIHYLNEKTRLPNVGFFDTSARAGLLCGISVSMKEQGFSTGKIACDLLKGKKPSDFKVKPTTRGRILLNLNTAEKLNIDLKYTILKNADEVIR